MRKPAEANLSSDAVVLPGRWGDTTGNATAVIERPPAAKPGGLRLDEEQLAPLVERSRAGDQGAFEELLKLLQGPVRSFARRLMKDPHLGDDAAQETFFRMWKALPRHEPRGKFVAWTFTVARNTCIELLRREKRTPTPAEEIEAGSHDPYERSDVAGMVNDAIAALDEPFRSTILLRETGLAYEEMAEALECPVGTVRSRLHEARRLLATKLRPLMETSDL